MENEISPKTLDDFVGNKISVEGIKKWAEEVKLDLYHPKRICFITGSSGTGKSVLAKLVLQKEGFTVREFIPSNLRIKQERDLLYQTLCFRDVLAILRKKSYPNGFRKAVIIDDFENMCLATLEIFKKVKEFVKKNKSIGVPIIFIGNKYFKGNRPLMGTSVYFRLYPRSIKDIQKILHYILNIFITKNADSYLIKIKNSYSEQISICKNSGGDVRKIIKYFELISNTPILLNEQSTFNAENPNSTNYKETKFDTSFCKAQSSLGILIAPVGSDAFNDKAVRSNNPIVTYTHEVCSDLVMLKNKRIGPLYSLDRTIRHDNNMNIKEISNEILNDSSLLYGIYTSYINYVPWVIKNNTLCFQKERCSKLWKNIAELFAICGNLKNYEKKNQMWEFTDIANIISCWGSRCLIKEEINAVYDINNKVKNKSTKMYNGKSFWWVELEKGKRTGDEPIDIPICNKMLRGHLNSHSLSNTSFKMIENGIGNSIAWKPKNIRGTIQILKLKKDNTPKHTHISNSTIFSKKITKVSDQLAKMVGIV